MRAQGSLQVPALARTRPQTAVAGAVTGLMLAAPVKRAVRYLQDDRAPWAAERGGCRFLRKHLTSWGSAGRFNSFDFELGQRAGSVRVVAADHARYDWFWSAEVGYGNAGLGRRRRSGSRRRLDIAASASVRTYSRASGETEAHGKGWEVAAVAPSSNAAHTSHEILPRFMLSVG